MKKYEYIIREFYPKISDPLLDKLNDYGERGYCVASANPVMYINDPQVVNKWIVIFMKEK